MQHAGWGQMDVEGFMRDFRSDFTFALCITAQMMERYPKAVSNARRAE